MESFLENYNIITPILLLFLLIPLFTGMFVKVTRNRIWLSLVSIKRMVELIISISIAFLITKLLFFTYNISLFTDIKSWINQNTNNSISPDTFIFLIFVPLFFILINSIIMLITIKFDNRIMYNFSQKLLDAFNILWEPVKILIKVIFQVPKAVINTLFVALLINVLSIYLPSPTFSEQLENSPFYQTIEKYTIEPLLNSSYVKKIPVLLNDSLSQINQSEVPQELMEGSTLPQYMKDGSKIVWYFNGVTLEEAVKSNQVIDNFAVNLVKNEPNSRKKARKIYKWVAGNIKYDYEKANKLSSQVIDIPSGAINAFNTRKGICFDSSALYVAMCRAVGLKVRLVVGMGFNGINWGEHSWNQVFIPEENKWINLDTTFAIGGNYFDRSSFDEDHKLAKIAGEW